MKKTAQAWGKNLPPLVKVEVWTRADVLDMRDVDYIASGKGVEAAAALERQNPEAEFDHS